MLKGVSVTQSGVVMSTVFIATIVFTPLFGKVGALFALFPDTDNT